MENIPRIPDNCAVNIQEGSWPSLPLFDVMRSIGNIPKMKCLEFSIWVLNGSFADTKSTNSIKKTAESDANEIFEIGKVISGSKEVCFST